MAHVRLACRDLWRHIRLGSENSVQEACAVTAFNRRCEAEVSDLHVIFRVEQDILRLQIAMAGSLAVNKVQCLQHLAEVEAADGWFKMFESNIVEDFTALDKLKDNVVNFFSCSIVGDFIGIFFEIVKAYDVLVVQILIHVDFITKELNRFLGNLRVLKVENLEGKLVTVLVCSKLDFGRDT